jgi:hypothetical protein
MNEQTREGRRKGGSSTTTVSKPLKDTYEFIPIKVRFLTIEFLEPIVVFQK